MADQELAQVLAHFLNTDDAAVAIKNIDGRYLFANQGYAQFAGVDVAQIIGRLDHEILPEPRAAALREAHEGARDRGDGVQVTDEAAGYVLNHFPVVDDVAKLIAIGVVAINASRALRDTLEAEQALASAEQVNAQLRTAVSALEQAASMDRLTRAWNRRRFEEALDGEMHRAIRFGHPVSLAVVDIDRFKAINDNFGHVAGDRVLSEFADCVREVLRKSDSLTRWGGEEFIVLMPNTPLAAARLAAERIRAHLEARMFPDVPTVTASLGVAEFAPMESAAEWLKRADDAMYSAKRAGRNRVEVDATPLRAGQPADHVEGNFVKLSWKQAFECGHALIDAQHRGLFQVSNELLAAILAGRPKDEIGRIVEQLIEDVVTHFRDEETILAEVGFDETEKHAAEHAKLSERAMVLAAAFREDRLSVGELFQFLAYDLVTRHMLGADRQYQPWVQAS